MATREHAVVGRDVELAAIDDFLAQPGERALVLEGEPGMGKTTLWLEAVARAEERDFLVLRAQPAESETRLSYAALADLVGPEYDRVRDELPEPQQRALDATLLRTAGSTNSRTVGSALISVLAALARDALVLLAIDDEQWLDRASARALEFAARRLPPGVKLLMAQRPGADVVDAGEPVERVMLGPLSLGALHHVLRTNVGSAPSRSNLIRIVETSGGNPFFALAIARALPESEDARAPLPIPPSLQQLVAGRLARLSPAAREAALVASALSRPTLRTIDNALGVAEAEEAGVLTVARDRVRFTHPLLASAVYGSAHGTQLLELHRRLADVVDDPEERAQHLALCTTEADEAVATELEAAAASAARRGAQDAAADLYEAAASLTPAAEDAARARRLVGRAVALHATGDPGAARELAERAVETAPPGPTRADALLELSRIAWVRPGGALGPLDYLRLALDDAGDDRQLSGMIQAKLGMYSDEDHTQAVEHSEAAVALLDEAADPGLLAYTLLTLLFYGAQTGRGIDEGLLQRALELERRAGREAERSSLVLIWYQCTDAHEAARVRHRLEDEWYRDRGEEIWVAEKRAHLAIVESRAGNWALARELIEQSYAELEPVGLQGPLAMPLWTHVRFDALEGRTEAARAALQPLLETRSSQPGSAWFATFALEALGFIDLVEGDFAGADRAFAELDSLLESIGVSVPFAVRSDADHVEAAVGLGDLERASRILDRFERRAASARRIWTSLTLPRARALIAAAEGDPDRALTLLDDVHGGSTLPFENARNILLRGSLQRRLKQKRAAALSLSEAVEIFDRLGAPDWSRRARDELGRVGLRRGDPDELTETERRIAELAATGLTNREVAQAAFVSPKTVEANLARVYRKLGIRSRAELGAAMAREGGTKT